MPILKSITEAEFTRQVIQLARLYGWRTAHFRPGMNRRGKWMTAVQGDGAGFPDLLMVRGDKVIAAELKVGRNKPTPEQDAWLDAFRWTGAATYVWTPGMWPAIETVLKA